MTDIERNELSENAMGGTELMATALAERLEPELKDKFQIICSRVRDIEEDKIPVLWLHDLPNDPESQHLADKESRDRFAKFVFVSNWQMNEYIHTYGLNWEDCYVIKNAIEPIKFEEKPKDGIVRLIYHSTPHRGLELLVPSFEYLAEKHENIELDVYSSFNLYGWSDIFAYPNIWPETSCLCAIEALDAGCLMLAPNYAALPETAASWGITYQWTPSHNKHANMFTSILDNMIQTLTANKDDAEPMIVQQKLYYDNYYSWDVRIQEWNQMLNNILWERNEL
jgi:UDP-glucose:(glucosyl)LPS alpha-1,2-glucosyltransferase